MKLSPVVLLALTGSASGQLTGTFPAALNLSSLNGTIGFVINGIDSLDRSGSSVSAAGDVNGDGIDDIIIGAFGGDPNGNLYAGESYVVFGKSTGFAASLELSSLNGTTGFVINGIDAGDFSGASVSAAGDVNGDGIDDIIIGAYNAGPNGNSAAGESYVVFGKSTGFAASLEPSSLNGTTGFVINGIDAFDRSGRSVSAAGDVNGDGINDLIIGARSADPNGNSSAGESYVVFGKSTGFAASLELSSLNGTTGFVINGIDAYDQSGVSVSSAGDVNGDGIDDIIIGADKADPNGNSLAGESYVVFGRFTQAWSAPAGGNFNDPANWFSAVPTGGPVFIQPAFGGTIIAPTTPLFLDALTLGADQGITRFEMQPSSLVSIADLLILPGETALAGDGIFVADAGIINSGLIDMRGMSLLAMAGITNTTDGTIAPVTGFVDGTITNSGVVDLDALSNAAGGQLIEFDINGFLINEVDGVVQMRRGVVQLDALGGLQNSGDVSVTVSTADMLGDITNIGTPDGMGGFTPLGSLAISGGSSLLMTDNLINQSVAVLTADSELIILGSLAGNGISGPGGPGTAGPVFVEDGITPGFSPGIAQFDGDLSLGINGTTVFEIGGLNPGTEHDQIIVAGTFGVGGTAKIELINGYAPSPGDSFQLLTFGALTGSFATLDIDPQLLSMNVDTSTLLVDGTISIPSDCLADVNGDGQVTPTDFTAWINAFNNNLPGCDQNGDDACTPTDFTAWIANFNAGC